LIIGKLAIIYVYLKLYDAVYEVYIKSSRQQNYVVNKLGLTVKYPVEVKDAVRFLIHAITVSLLTRTNIHMYIYMQPS